MLCDEVVNATLLSRVYDCWPNKDTIEYRFTPGSIDCIRCGIVSTNYFCG